MMSIPGLGWEEGGRRRASTYCGVGGAEEAELCMLCKPLLLLSAVFLLSSVPLTNDSHLLLK